MSPLTLKAPGKFLLLLIPSLYFISLFVWSWIQNNDAGQANTIQLAVATPFIIQLFFQRRSFSIILGALTLIMSVYLVFAWWSDVAKISDFTLPRSRKFVMWGALLLVGNFVMSPLFFLHAHRVGKDKKLEIKMKVEID